MTAKYTQARKWLAIMVIVLLSLLWVTPVALAAEFRGGDKVIIGADQVIENLLP